MQQYECLSEIHQEAVRCCDPHVMTGACKLLHNLLLEFPDPLRAHILTHSTIGTLIRSVLSFYVWQTLWIYMFVNLLSIFDCSVVDFELFGLFLLGYNSGSIRYIKQL